MRLLLIGLLSFLSCQVEATTAPDDAALEAARAALARFNQTPPYLSERQGRQEQMDELSGVCTTGDLTECVDFIRANRVSALQALPDNPLYWRHLTLYLATHPVGIDPGPRPWESKDPRFDTAGLLNAIQHWGWYQIAKHGVINAERLAEQLRNARHMRTTSANMLERMLFTACHGVLLQWVPVALATAADVFDEAGIGELQQELRALSVQERSYVAVFRYETEYAQRVMDQEPTSIDEYRARYGNDISGDEYLKQRQIGETYIAHLPQIAEAIGRLGQQSDADFWANGLNFPPPASATKIPKEAFAYTNTWGMFAGLDYQFNLEVHLLNALADIHKGIVSPGLPVRPPPARWRWDWEVEEQNLCLVGVELHPQAMKVTSTEALRCVPYLEAAAARL